ncbi:ankyrin repeat domain-containing protein [Ottowia sp.]|uniref:ankyrin repeat domain-containing protein n=1 Tax=Ottowia sp. TaxID=1898956 RepID=UPI002D1FA6DE|nr:ankyrin repeat domain-containing protein [Ottowia sp.]MCP5259658.1 ankyrin repeat domain-containing protein [Burkholderiaceae bacterium]
MKSLKSLALAALLSFAAAGAWASDAADEFIRAIKQDSGSGMTALLRQGVDPNTRDPRGVPGLYLALQEGSLDAAKAILAAPRLNPNALTPTDESPLMMAALKGQVDIARALIAKGGAVNKSGWTPLHYAATGGNTDMIRLLLDHRATVEALSPNETTPLMMAARYGSVEAVQMLLRAGADPRRRNGLGMDALDFAVSGERPDAIELLTQAKRRAPVRPVVPAPESAPPGTAVQVLPQDSSAMPPPGMAIQVTPRAGPASAPRGTW